MTRAERDERDLSPRDFAARAAWLSYVGGLTQDQIARELGISRQRAQRLVARAMAEGLVRVRISHPIAACLEMERDLKERYELEAAWVAPSMGSDGDPVHGVAVYAAPVLEQIFGSTEPKTIAIGTGRTLRAVVENIEPVQGGAHKLVSLNGNVAPDGSATAYEVIVRLAGLLSIPQYPLSIPLVARSQEEFELYLSLPHVAASRALARAADIAIVGIGHMSDNVPLYVDGFITAEELASLQAAGAAGELAGHVFDAEGRYLDHPVNDRIMGVRVSAQECPVCCIAAGASKRTAVEAALKGRLITHLVIDEASAKHLLAQ
ncbi:sugar-binding transcriptional regulator [Tropicimonas marinistellae]|uniref:sugar-binding transcriptional regulator n=1 Tax=Tropicimonas marinistellae TaxID=1739787 RepID=UPI00082E2F18|nr:sugar-binding domain-containing protein [Tropicimonas marinistellae]